MEITIAYPEKAERFLKGFPVAAVIEMDLND
jgi:hypothetical protein